MSEAQGRTYHVLLIGINKYPDGCDADLAGCVNDIDAIEQLLCDPPGCGLPAAQLRVTRLAAPLAGDPSPSRFADQTLAPTKANVVAALRDLAAQAQPGDSVLVYYSGHGARLPVAGTAGWRDGLVTSDGSQFDFLCDLELNALINHLAARLSGDDAARPADLTVVLDCCHSGGATARRLRADAPKARVRAFSPARCAGFVPSAAAADPAILALNPAADRGTAPAPTDDAYRGTEPAPTDDGRQAMTEAVENPKSKIQNPKSAAPTPLLLQFEPNYLVIAGCQPDESVNEGTLPAASGQDHGLLTWSLIGALAALPAAARPGLRWADLWATLLDQVVWGSGQLGVPPQHPWPIGRLERRVFGGSWQRTDLGPSVSLAAIQEQRPSPQLYAIAAGTLLGFEPGALVAVYGPQPLLFPPLRQADGTPNTDDQLMQLLVNDGADRLACTATWQSGTTRVPPLGARARLVQPGPGRQLRVGLTSTDPDQRAAVAAALNASPVLQVAGAATRGRPDPQDDPEVWVDADPAGGWTIRNDVEPAVAVTPPGADTLGRPHAGSGAALIALGRGLEAYAAYNRVLRLAYTCTDRALDQALSCTLVRCDDPQALQAVADSRPTLPELRRDADGIYHVAAGFPLAIQIASTYPALVHVTLFECSSGGQAGLINANPETLDSGEQKLIWLGGIDRNPFYTAPDPTRGDAAGTVTDRVVLVATTNPAANLQQLATDRTVQQVIDAAARGLGAGPAQQPAAPADAWAARVVPLRIDREM